MPPPRSGEGLIVLPLTVRTDTVVLFMSPQLLLQYLMQGSETCNAVPFLDVPTHKRMFTFLHCSSNLLYQPILNIIARLGMTVHRTSLRIKVKITLIIFRKTLSLL